MRTPNTRGTDLSPLARAQALAGFVHRYTGDHIPAWANKEWKDGKPYPLQFKDDADWLASSLFVVNKDGSLHAKANCESHPTWPNNPELRRGWLSSHAEHYTAKASTS